MRHLNDRTAVRRRGTRAFAASAAVVVGLTGFTACSETAGPETGEVTAGDLQELEDQVAALEERVGAVEESDAGETVGEADIEDPSTEVPTLEEMGELVGQQVTISAEVSELYTDSGEPGAFTVAGESGEAIVVIGATGPERIEPDDVVQVSGTVKLIDRATFEEDFGYAEDEVFDSPDEFFEEADGQPAIAATEVQVLQEQADG